MILILLLLVVTSCIPRDYMMIHRCLILSKSHRGYDEEINQFLQEDSIYSTIQTVLSHLSISQ